LFLKLRKLRARTGLYPLLALTLSFLAGVLAWGGFNTALEATNTERFCIGCHEMRDYVFQEYRQTIHYRNRSGVRATCPDCHVPKDWTHKVVRKIGATNELFHKLIGSIDTREKFEARRLHLARQVWNTLQRSDSRECRNCHSFTAMQADLQDAAGRQQHLAAENDGQTCIDCHKGIAHHLPEAFVEQEHKRYQQEKRSCVQCHAGIAQPPQGDSWSTP